MNTAALEVILTVLILIVGGLYAAVGQAGATGTGGGIFLAPIILLFH